MGGFQISFFPFTSTFKIPNKKDKTITQSEICKEKMFIKVTKYFCNIEIVQIAI